MELMFQLFVKRLNKYLLLLLWNAFFFKETGLFARNQLTVEIGPNNEIGNGQFVGD